MTEADNIKQSLAALLSGAKRHFRYVTRQHEFAISQAAEWETIAAYAQSHNSELAETNRRNADVQVANTVNQVCDAQQALNIAQKNFDEAK